MSHPEQMEFFAAVASANRNLIPGAAILEVGSYDVNGGIRQLFYGAKRYVGVDLCEGPGVDVVAYGHELDHPADSYDIALSGECFEHDAHWRSTFLNMVRLVRPGGLVAFSCASRGRLEHGTARTDPRSSPGTDARGSNYYRNLEERDFRELEIDHMFSRSQFWYLSGHFDLLFVGIKKGGSDQCRAQLPDGAEIARLNKLMSLPYKAVTLPLRGLSKVMPDSRYQNLALPLTRPLAPAVVFFEKRRRRNFAP
jgi:SAM-dependent methyltransferase